MVAIVDSVNENLTDELGTAGGQTAVSTPFSIFTPNGETLMSTGEPQADHSEQLLRGLLDFHSREAQSLLDRYRHIEHLIGKGQHNSSDGDFCEDLVRQFLRQVLPKRYSVDHGFILHTPRDEEGTPSCVSGQLDVIVHDDFNYHPFFRSGEFVVVLPAAVAAIIEVKKTLTSANLKESLQGLGSANEILLSGGRSLRDSFTGVFAFAADEDLRPKNRPISMSYNSCLHEVFNIQPQRSHVPDVIVVVTDHVFFRVDDEVNEEFALFDIFHLAAQQGKHNISIQAFFGQLSRKLDLPEVRSGSGRLVFPLETTMERYTRLKQMPPHFASPPVQNFKDV